jgi:hypothetical protein
MLAAMVLALPGQRDSYASAPVVDRRTTFPLRTHHGVEWPVSLTRRGLARLGRMTREGRQRRVVDSAAPARLVQVVHRGGDVAESANRSRGGDMAEGELCS